VSLLGRLLGAEDGGYATQGPLDDYWYGERGAGSRAGVTVNAETACGVSTVFRCVAVIAEAVAQLPLHLNRQTADGKTRETNALASLLARWPNPTDTAFEFREALVANALLAGRGYARIHPGALGAISELELLHPRCVREERIKSTRRAKFIYTPPEGGAPQPITQEEMFVLRGPFHAPRGIVAAARDSIGFTIAGERFGSAQYARKPQFPGVIELPGTLSDEKASKRMAESFRRSTAGEDGWFLPAVLEVGATWKQTGMSMIDAQWLDSRRFQVPEICRWFGVPPHMVGHLEGQGYGSVEQLSIEFVRTCIRPWGVRFEQAVDRDLLVDEQLSAELDIDQLSRGDTKARHEAHRISLGGNAFKSPDEVRAEEGLPPRGGRWGEIPVQLNTKQGSNPNDEPNNDPGAPNA
jgi:HK97 family phage portal protein